MSGVAGQYNFVATRGLADARSIRLSLATHEDQDGLKNGIAWDCRQLTIPRNSVTSTGGGLSVRQRTQHALSRDHDSAQFVAVEVRF